MFTALTIAGLVLFGVALCERRSWPMCAVVGVVFALGNVSYLGPTDDALALRIPFDTIGGLLTIAAILRFSLYDRLSMLQPFFFMAQIALHFVFWSTWANGVDLWSPYAFACNAVWIAQLVVLATPGGRNVRRLLSRWFRAPRARRFAGLASGRVHHRAEDDQP